MPAPGWRDAMIEEALTWEGTPYQHKGRIKGVGVDCGGLVYQVYEPHLGPFPPFPKDYAPDWGLHRDNEMYLDFIMPFVVEVDKPVRGGLTMVRIGRNFCHAAICIGDNQFLHAYGRNQHGSVVKSKIGFFRHPGTKKMREMKHFDVRE